MSERTYLCQTCEVRFTYKDARNHVCIGARDIHWAFQVSEEARCAAILEAEFQTRLAEADLPLRYRETGGYYGQPIVRHHTGFAWPRSPDN